VFLPDSLRDRLGGNTRLIAAVAAPVAWIGLAALFGTVQLSDLFAAGVLALVFGLKGRRKKPEDDRSEGGMYGPPE
jgi:hypothetical protein